jgi:hypothetical protein
MAQNMRHHTIGSYVGSDTGYRYGHRFGHRPEISLKSVVNRFRTDRRAEWKLLGRFLTDGRTESESLANTSMEGTLQEHEYVKTIRHAITGSVWPACMHRFIRTMVIALASQFCMCARSEHLYTQLVFPVLRIFSSQCQNHILLWRSYGRTSFAH